MPTSGSLERILHLRRLRAFASLGPEELVIVAEHARERFFRKGTVLLCEGEAVDAIYFVVEGTVHLARRGRLMGHAVPGDGVVGGLAVLARDDHGIEAVAETDAVVLELDRDTLLEVLEDEFSILHRVLQETCREILVLLARNPATFAAGLPGRPPVPLPARELDLCERLILMRRVPSFARASLDALAELSRSLAETRVAPGTKFWEAGEPSGAIELVVDGTVACLAPDGTAFDAGPGAALGTLESLAGAPRWHTAVAETEVRTLRGHVESLVDVLEDNGEMGTDYLSTVSRWLLDLLEGSRGPDEEALERFYGVAQSGERPT